MTDPFQPSWSRGLLIVVVAAIGFFLPQAVPLEYYSLNNPSSGLNYLEITCAANVQGETNIYLDNGRGFNEFEKIRLPISPGQSAYTYTFPLPDAPLRHLTLVPFVGEAGEFTITNFRIINRRGEEIHRFTREDFQSLHQIDAIVPTGGGWKLVVKSPTAYPVSQVRISRPIVPEGMNGRNLQRCLLSCGYLALMLWILLLAVYFALTRMHHTISRADASACADSLGARRLRRGSPDNPDSIGAKVGPTGRIAHTREGERCGLRLRRDACAIARAVVFLAFVALLFSLVGNRGLIKNSIRCARYTPPVAHAP